MTGCSGELRHILETARAVLGDDVQSCRAPASAVLHVATVAAQCGQVDLAARWAAETWRPVREKALCGLQIALALSASEDPAEGESALEQALSGVDAKGRVAALRILGEMAEILRRAGRRDWVAKAVTRAEQVACSALAPEAPAAGSSSAVRAAHSWRIRDGDPPAPRQVSRLAEMMDLLDCPDPLPARHLLLELAELQLDHGFLRGAGRSLRRLDALQRDGAQGKRTARRVDAYRMSGRGRHAVDPDDRQRRLATLHEFAVLAGSGRLAEAIDRAAALEGGRHWREAWRHLQRHVRPPMPIDGALDLIGTLSGERWYGAALDVCRCYAAAGHALPDGLVATLLDARTPGHATYGGAGSHPTTPLQCAAGRGCEALERVVAASRDPYRRVRAALDVAGHCARNGDRAAAVHALERALAEHAALPDAWRRGRTLLPVDAAETKGERQVATIQYMRDPTPFAEIAIGDTLCDLGEHARAASFYEQAAEKVMADCCWRDGRPDPDDDPQGTYSARRLNESLRFVVIARMRCGDAQRALRVARLIEPCEDQATMLADIALASHRRATGVPWRVTVDAPTGWTVSLA